MFSDVLSIFLLFYLFQMFYFYKNVKIEFLSFFLSKTGDAERENTNAKSIICGFMNEQK